MMALHQPVQHGVGHGLVSDPLVPMLDGELTGDDGCTVVGTVINDLQQVRSGLTVHGRHAPVVAPIAAHERNDLLELLEIYSSSIMLL